MTAGSLINYSSIPGSDGCAQQNRQKVERLYSPMNGKNTLWRLLSGEQLAGFTGAIFILFIGICITSYHGSRKLNDCLPAPYLYVSYGTDHNIFQITRDGCVTMNKVLYKVPRKKVELRSLALGEYKGKKNVLYVADAARKTRNVMVFGECSYWSRMRSLETKIMDAKSPFRDGAIHAYGMSFDNNGNLYVSYQHTNVILRSTKDTFKPMELPLAMQKREREEGMKLFEGTFYQFGAPEIHNESDQGIRSISWASNDQYGELLWVANEFENQVTILDSDANVVRTIEVIQPIGLYHTKDSVNIFENGRIYIGSRGRQKLGHVFAFDSTTFELLSIYSMIGMTHPTGITVHGDTLFVADQALNSILTFDLVSGRYVNSIWSRNNGNIEQIALSDC